MPIEEFDRLLTELLKARDRVEVAAASLAQKRGDLAAKNAAFYVAQAAYDKAYEALNESMRKDAAKCLSLLIKARQLAVFVNAYGLASSVGVEESAYGSNAGDARQQKAGGLAVQLISLIDEDGRII